MRGERGEEGRVGTLPSGLLAEGDARLAQIVRGHFDVDLVADADADEVLAHLAGDMSEDLVAVGQGHAKHRPGQDLRHPAVQFDWLFFSHDSITGFRTLLLPAPGCPRAARKECQPGVRKSSATFAASVLCAEDGRAKLRRALTFSGEIELGLNRVLALPYPHAQTLEGINAPREAVPQEEECRARSGQERP